MTSSETLNDMEERLSAWKLDDPEWVKERKRKWRSVKNSPILSLLTKEEQRRIKTFYSTGIAFDPEPNEEEWRYLCYHPAKRPLPVSSYELFECWLDPEPSEERWSKVRDKAIIKSQEYALTTQFFRRCLHDYVPKKGSLFNGLDEKLYKFLCLGRCRREDYLDIDEKGFYSISRSIYKSFVPQIEGYLQPDFNPCLIAPALLDEWSDALETNYTVFDDKYRDLGDPYIYLKNILKPALVIIRNPESYEEKQVAFSKRLIDRFRDMDMPPEMSKAILSFLAE